MFSGIIEEFAKVVAIRHDKENIDFTLTCSFVEELTIDQSVAHNGVCLTVVEIKDEPGKSDAPAPIRSVDYKANNPGYVYNVFDIRGNKVAQFKIGYGEKTDVKDIVASLVKRSGFYLLKPAHGGMVKKIAITK